MIVKCPKCGSSDIREKNVAYAELRVTEWDVDEHGTLIPASYDTDEGADWTTFDEAPEQYVCHGHDAKGLRCEWQGTLEGLRLGGLDIGEPLGCAEN
jgi:hypothetical protein